jgi:CubicO group peptidase (beta-lactamase class C family)
MRRIVDGSRAGKLALACVAMSIACTPNGTSTQTGSEQTSNAGNQNLGTRLDSFLIKAERLGYSGVWLVVQNGVAILEGAYGYSDRENAVHFTPASPFPLGSISKQFTAAAILLLQERGRLSVRDSLHKFFPQAPADKRSITVHQLLTHTAGLPTYSGNDDELISRDTLVARMMRAKLSSVPGSKFDYSNPGYSLLAVIIENATGSDYESFVRDSILLPLGMTHTTSSLTLWPRDSLPVGYLGDRSKPSDRYGDHGRFSNGELSWNLQGNAGMISTARDMLAWGEAWDKGTILSDSSRRLSTTRHTPWGSDTTRFYGYGWILEGPPDDRRASHSGGDGMSSAEVTRYVDRGFTTVSFTNHSRGPHQFVVRAVHAAVMGTPLPELPTARTSLDETVLRKFVGDYLLPTGDTIPVQLLNGQIVIPNDRRGSARAITCFDPLEDSSLVTDIHARVEKIFSALAKDDLAPVLAVMWPAGSVESERAYWKETWPDWIKRFGAYRGIEILGSLPGTSRMRPGVSIMNTYALLRFERGQYLLTVMQDPEGRLFFDTSTISLLQPRYYYVPRSADSFETFNFMLKTRSTLRFEADGEAGPEGLIIGCGRKMRARRIRH